MDFYHRSLEGRDTRHGRECQFCRQSDPDFEKRKPLDRLVQSEQSDSASGHLTEDGYVKHRMTELLKRLGTIPSNVWLPESA
jgi:hypothetical protein